MADMSKIGNEISDSNAGKSLTPWAFVAWAAVASLAANLVEIDWSQDLGAYSQNFQDIFRGVQNVDRGLKSLWYDYYIRPISFATNEEAIIIAIIKSNILLLFLVGYSKKIRSHKDAFIFTMLLCYCPIISENINEYLRQGVAIGLFLVAIRLSSNYLRVPLAILSISMHQSIIFIGLFYFIGFIFERFFSDRSGMRSSFVPYLISAGLAAALIFSFVGAPFDITLGFGSSFLEGRRSNILGALSLFIYATYLAYKTLLHGSASGYAKPLVGALVICALYSSIGDIGRALSLVMPFHLLVALGQYDQSKRDLDLLAIVVMSFAFSYGQYIL